MGSFSIWHWAVVGAIVVLLFGGKVFSRTMADIGQGLKELKKINKEAQHEDPQ